MVVGTNGIYHRQVIGIGQASGDSLMYLYHWPDDMDFPIEKRLNRLHGGEVCTEAEVHQAGLHQIVEVMTHCHQLYIVLLAVVEKDSPAISRTKVTVELTVEGCRILVFINYGKIVAQVGKESCKLLPEGLGDRMLYPVDQPAVTLRCASQAADGLCLPTFGWLGI